MDCFLVIFTRDLEGFSIFFFSSCCFCCSKKHNICAFKSCLPIVESPKDLPYGDIIWHTIIGERLKAETVKDRENNTILDNVKERNTAYCLQELTAVMLPGSSK
jgi:hypothetical protein